MGSEDRRQSSKASRSSSKDSSPPRRAARRRSIQKGEDAEAEKKAEQRRPGFEKWKETNFRIGAQMSSIAQVPVEQPPDQQNDISLLRWFDVSLNNFSGIGSLFGSMALPTEYQSIEDDYSVPWIKHRRTGVLLWPVRIMLGIVSDPMDALTIFYYCSPSSMLNFTMLISKGADALALFDAVLIDATAARKCEANDPRDHQGGGFPATVCEPAKYATRADVLFDRIGQTAWPPTSENKRDASRCLAFTVPVHSLVLETAERPDRVLVFGRRLRPMIQASVAWNAKPAYFRSIGFEDIVVSELPESTWELVDDCEAKIRKGRKRIGLLACIFTEGGGGKAKDIWEVDVPRRHLARIRYIAKEAAKRDNGSLVLVDAYVS